MGRGLFSGGQQCPTPKRRDPSAPQFWGFLSIYAYTLCLRTTKFDAVRHGGGLFLEFSHAPPQVGRAPALSNLWRSAIFMRTPFNAERPNSAWWNMARYVF